jgi:uncharacterized membrane protein YsdA (DUF1294 family)/cold shock CspA family protein
MAKGKLVQWDDEKGYGFIAPDDGKLQLFVHISAFTDPSIRPTGGERVSYRIGEDKRGRPCAEQVVLPGAKGPRRRPLGRVSGVAWALLATGTFFALLGIAAMLQWISPLWPLGYGLLSLITFALYGLDKRAAQRNQWRTPEANLHLFALAGGWPGALIAQQTFRHKTSKQPFQTIFWLTLLTNLGLLIWLTIWGPKIETPAWLSDLDSISLPAIPDLPTPDGGGLDVNKCIDEHGVIEYTDKRCE